MRSGVVVVLVMTVLAAVLFTKETMKSTAPNRPSWIASKDYNHTIEPNYKSGSHCNTAQKWYTTVPTSNTRRFFSSWFGTIWLGIAVPSLDIRPSLFPSKMCYSLWPTSVFADFKSSSCVNSSHQMIHWKLHNPLKGKLYTTLKCHSIVALPTAELDIIP